MLSEISADVFSIDRQPVFRSYPNRLWDSTNKEWCALSDKAKKTLGWEANTDLKQGLSLTAAWYSNLSQQDLIAYESSSKSRI